MELKILIVVSSLIVPILMLYTELRQPVFGKIYHFIALIAFLIFGNIAALSVYQVIKERTVFTMEIHGLFLNPFFLIAGSYIGIYLVYYLLLLSLDAKN